MIEYNQSDLIQWVNSNAGWAPLFQEQCYCIGYKDEKIRCVVAYEQYTGGSISAHIFSDNSKKWVKRKFIKAILDYPFEYLKVNKVISAISSNNKNILLFCKKFGFTLDYVYEKCGDNQSDLLIVSLDKEKRFL